MNVNKKFKDFKDLEHSMVSYLTNDEQFSDRYISRFKYSFYKLELYLKTKKLERYSPELNQDIRYFFYKDQPTRSLADREQDFLRYLLKISEFHTTGQVTHNVHRVDREYVFEGNIGVHIQSFMKHREKSVAKGSRLLDVYRPVFVAFHHYCVDEKINHISEVSLESILNFIKTAEDKSAHKVETNIRALRVLFQYFFDYNIIHTNISKKLPRFRRVKHPKLPSTYTVDEIERLLNSVFRNSKIGKRNYAILLLATRLGLRACDISNLKFENLDWMKSTIEIKTIKTGQALSLPLLSDVGESIIDYLKHGRQTSNLPYVFLTGKNPATSFQSSNIITHIVQRAFKDAGIDIAKRKFGPHALRHSLVDRLLKTRSSLPIVSSILAHKDSKSTMFYLRIDLESLSVCNLEVPPLDISFYNQKGGNPNV